MEALRAVTLDAARAVHLDDRVGSLEPGKQADIVVLGKDPLADIGNVRDVLWVFKDGRDGSNTLGD
jgi:imidazolonepropionase-like amidohydrolase